MLVFVLVCVFGVQYAGVACGILLTAWYVLFSILFCVLDCHVNNNKLYLYHGQRGTFARA